MTQFSNQIQIPMSFFRKERTQIYANWKLAVFREFFQNSLDAGATEIRIALTEGEGPVRSVLTFDDNGPGMGRDTLDNVYFRMGASTKDNDPTSTGGFGRARILTCFAMEYYKIWTRDNIVFGRGAGYNIDPLNPPYAGCKIQIGIDAAGVDQMAEAFRDYWKMSEVTHCRVFFNGEEQVPGAAAGEHVRDLEHNGEKYAEVRVAEPGVNAGHINVRVNGHSMYTRYFGGKQTVTLDLVPSLARKVLTANRDSMHWDYQHQLDQFIRSAASNSQALRNQFTIERRLLKGSGMLVARRPEPKPRKEGNTKLGDRLIKVAEQKVYGDVIQKVMAGAVTASDVARDADADGKLTGEQLEQHGLLPNILVIIDAKDAGLRAKAEQFDPKNWEFQIEGDKLRFTKGRDAYRLWATWKLAMEHAIHAYLKADEFNGSIAWGAGFVISDHCAAMTENGDDGRFFLINPYQGGKERFPSLRNQQAAKRLMADAKHEVCHIEYPYHDESFASLLGAVDGEFSEWACWNEILRLRFL